MPSLARLSRPIAITSFLLIAGSYVINAMDRSVFPVLLPSVAHEYGFDLARGGFLATIFTLGLGVAGVPSGFLFGRMSRKNITILGVIIYSVCTLLTCLSVGFYDMAAYRAVSGVGEAFQNAAIFTACGAYFSRNRTLALGLLNVAYGVGAFIGPRWGTVLLAQGGGWHFPMYVYGAIGLAAVLALWFLVPRGFTEQRAQDEDIADESHIPPTLYHRNTLLVGLAAFGAGLATYGYLGLYPTFLRTTLNFSPAQAGVAASMYGVGALSGIVCGYIADRANQKWITIIMLAALGVVGYLIFNVAVSPMWQNILSLLEGVASSGFLFVNNYSLMQRSVRADLAGRASGLVVSCLYLPAAASGYVFALLKERFDWGDAALIQMSLVLIVPVIGMLFFDLSRTSCPVRARRHGSPAG